MLRWLKKTPFGSRSSDLPKEHSDQIVWIKGAMRDWQLQWHDLFDTDRDLVASGEFERPDPLPDDVDCDYRLIFGLSRATSKTRQMCFEVFPEGAKMHERFQNFLSSKPVALGEAEARARLTEVIALIEEIGPNEDVDFSSVAVLNRETREGLEVLNDTDDITILLEKSLLTPYPVEDLQKIAAESFLTEPLYAAAGNFYQVLNWVTGAMTEGSTDRLHSELYELWTGGWQVALGSDGLILASRKM